MKYTILALMLIAFSTACRKTPSVDVVGHWQIDKQLNARYSGLEKTSETMTELCDSYMQLNNTGTGSLIYPTAEMPFSYVVNEDELVLATEFCKSSTWYIVEFTGTNMVIEHNNPSMVTVRYLSRID